MPIVLDPEGRAAMGALELRRRLDDATFGDVLILLGREGLPLPRAPIAGREAHLAKAGKWLFGDDDG